MIRQAVIDDLNEIRTVSKELGYKDVSLDTAKYRLKTIIESDVDEIAVYDDQQVKGWIHFFVANRVASPSFVEIGGLVVSSQFRREGIGTALVHHVIKWAHARGLKTRVRCNSKRDSAHNFYTSVGFSKSKEQFIFEKQWDEL